MDVHVDADVTQAAAPGIAIPVVIPVVIPVDVILEAGHIGRDLMMDIQ